MVGALICLIKNLPKVVKDKHQKESQRQSKKGNSVSGGYRLYDIYEDNTPKYSYQKQINAVPSDREQSASTTDYFSINNFKSTNQKKKQYHNIKS